MKRNKYQLKVFSEVITNILGDNQLFFNAESDQYLLTIYLNKTEKLEQKLEVLLDLFFDVAVNVRVFWGNCFSIIGYTKIEQSLIYGEE
jgi:hypothetical protein